MSFPNPPHTLPMNHPAWIQYFNLLTNALTDDRNVEWDAVDKSGSSLADIESRPHSDLTNILAANEESTDTDKDKHTSSNDLKVAVDHYAKEVDPSSTNLIRDKHVANNDLNNVVKGQGTSTDNSVARWDGITGLAIQTSSVIIDDSDDVSGIVNLMASGVITGDTLDAIDTVTTRQNLGVEIGVDVQAWDADLDSLAALSTTGMMARVAAETYTMRTITAADGRIVVTNGDGVAGDPTIALGVKVVTTKTANYTVTSADDVILADTSVNPFTLTLPVAITGVVKIIKLINASNVLTIDGDGSETIDGSLTVTLSILNISLTFVGLAGTGWYII